MKAKLRSHREANICPRNQYDAPPSMHNFNSVSDHRLIKSHDKPLTDSFLDKLMPSFQLLTKLEGTIPHIRRVEKMCRLRNIKFELTKFTILSGTLDPTFQRNNK